MKPTIQLFLIWVSISNVILPLCAQTDSLVADSITVDEPQIKQTIHSNYSYLNGARQTNYIQINQYDSTGLVVRQERDHYQASDTGTVLYQKYYLEYHPNTLLGAYQTERFAIGNNRYHLQKTSFKNYDRSSNKRYWVKTYKANSQQLAKQIRYEYDNNGYLIGKESTDYTTTPTSRSIEKVNRNAAGNMLTWTSYDDDGDTKVQARSFKATYLNDTLLLRSDDQLYYNMTTVINQYDRKGQLRKTDKKVGNKTTKGKITYNNLVVTLYKEGRPYWSSEKSFKKKARTITYEYTPTETIKHMVTPKKSYTDRIQTDYHDQYASLPILRTETKEGELFLTEMWTYSDSSAQPLQHVGVEKRDNGTVWRTEELYNQQGDLKVKRFFVDGVLTTEDTYEHHYR